MMHKQSFSQSDVNKIYSHIATRTLHSWVEAGLVEFSDVTEDRRGKHRRYDLLNLYQFALVETLLELRIAMKPIKHLMEFAFDWPIEVWKSSILMFNKVKYTMDKDEFDSISDDGIITLAAYEVPGYASIIREKSLDQIITKELLTDSQYIIVVPLSNVVKKVEHLLRSVS
jgi:hypothetical protein